MGRGLFADDMRDYEEALRHHGIDGQKWGVRHGPPYPLKEAVSRAVQGIKGKGKTEAKGSDSAVKATKGSSSALNVKEIASYAIKNVGKTKNKEPIQEVESDHPGIRKLQTEGEKNWCRFNIWERDGTNFEMPTNIDAQAASVLVDRGYSVMQKDTLNYGSITSPKDIASLFLGAKIEAINTREYEPVGEIADFMDKKSKNEKGFILYKIGRDYRHPNSNAANWYGPMVGKYAAIEVHNKTIGPLKVPAAVQLGNRKEGIPIDIGEAIAEFNANGRDYRNSGEDKVYYIRTDNLELNPSIFDHVTPV